MERGFLDGLSEVFQGGVSGDSGEGSGDPFSVGGLAVSVVSCYAQIQAGA